MLRLVLREMILVRHRNAWAILRLELVVRCRSLRLCLVESTILTIFSDFVLVVIAMNLAPTSRMDGI